MKSRLQLLFYNVLVLSAFVFTNKSYSQINYSQNFDLGNFGWSEGEEVYSSPSLSCSGNSLLMKVGDFGTAATSMSPAIGISNGQLATLSYNFKILNNNELPLTNTPNWGTFVVEYATSLLGPWTIIQTISPANHIVSEDCAIKTATFTPIGGNNIYLKITSTANENITCTFYVDDVTVVQAASLPCTGTPAAMTTIAARPIICNEDVASLSLNPYPVSAGLVFQWQSSLDGVTYTNIIGGTAVTLNAPQNTTTWYRANVSCGLAGTVVTSTPVQVISSGVPCLCEVVFSGAVEPITLVQFAGINNVTPAVINGTPSTENFYNLGPVQVVTSETYPIVLKGNTDGFHRNYLKVFIDFNHNGDLNDAGESFVIGSIIGSNGLDNIQAIGNITIPNNATLGLTNMRVYKRYFDTPLNACYDVPGSFSYGQVEDYLLNIVAPCTTAAPVAASVQTLCGGATVSNLQATGTDVKWYLNASVGFPLEENFQLVDGAVYYATQTIGCESTVRTAVTVTIDNVLVDDVQDVTACFEYILPALENGKYYTATNGGGTMLAAGTVIAESTTVYVHVVSEANSACTAEDSFEITINAPAAPSGNDTVVDGTGILQLSEIELEATGTITWYATEDDAKAGENPLTADTVAPAGSTVYYATQTIDECESEPFAVTVDVVLGREDFDLASFRYYPNPVNDVLNVSYSRAMTAITVFNLLGQEVITKTINQSDAQIDLAKLAAGTYMVKVQSEDAFKVIKIVKK